jgi:hypothetical protein
MLSLLVAEGSATREDKTRSGAELVAVRSYDSRFRPSNLLTEQCLPQILTICLALGGRGWSSINFKEELLCETRSVQSKWDGGSRTSNCSGEVGERPAEDHKRRGTGEIHVDTSLLHAERTVGTSMPKARDPENRKRTKQEPRTGLCPGLHRVDATRATGGRATRSIA